MSIGPVSLMSSSKSEVMKGSSGGKSSITVLVLGVGRSPVGGGFLSAGDMVRGLSLWRGRTVSVSGRGVTGVGPFVSRG